MTALNTTQLETIPAAPAVIASPAKRGPGRPFGSRNTGQTVVQMKAEIKELIAAGGERRKAWYKLKKADLELYLAALKAH